MGFLLNIKRTLIYILITALLLSSAPVNAKAEATGKLNVFTDLADAEIFIDAHSAGKEAVVGYILPVGSHFVKVTYQGKTVFTKTVEISE